jgi:hypothetical protein
MIELKEAGNTFHELLRMYFSDSKLVSRQKRRCSIQEIDINSNPDETHAKQIKTTNVLVILTARI